jgi:ribonuclease PH
MLNGETILDLCYEEDSRAEVDANVVMTDAGRFVEFQATAEHKTFDDAQMNSMTSLAQAGIVELLAVQKAAIELS